MAERGTTQEQPGVSDGEEVTTQRPPTGSRSEIMAKAAASRREQLGLSEAGSDEAEAGNATQAVQQPRPGDPERMDDPQPPATGDTRQAQPKPAAAPQSGSDPQPPVYFKNGAWMTKRKVNGVEEEVSFEELRRISQKEAAADAKLRQAAERERAIQAKEAQIREQMQARAAQAPKPVERKPDPALIQEKRELRRKLAEAVLDENQADQDRIWTRLDEIESKSRPESPAFDPDQLAARTAEVVELRVRKQTERSAINEFFGIDENGEPTKNTDILQDDTLYQLVDQGTARIRQQHPDWAPSRVLDESAKQTREWIRTMSGAPPTRTQATPSERTGARREAKRNASGVIPTGGNQRQTAPAEAPPPTRAEQVNAARKARGLPPL